MATAAFPTVHERKRISEVILGAEWKQGKTWSVFIGRIALGFLFLWSASQKVLTELGGKMATSGFLSGPSVASGPLAGFFNSLSGNLAVEYLVVYGELLVGVALLFGIFTRVGVIGGALLMLLFTVAMWPIADTAGANPLVDFRVIYGALLMMFFFLRPGLFLGVDGPIENTSFVEKHPRLRLLLG